MLAHDETIDRVSDGSGWIKDYTLAELRGFSFSKVHPEFDKVEIPTLEDLLYLVQDTDLELNLELKSGVLYYDGLEEKTADLVHAMGMDERVIYSSFCHYSVKKAMAYCREKGYHSHFGILSGTLIGKAAEYVQGLGADAYHPPAAQMNEKTLSECHARGLKVHLNNAKKYCDYLMVGVNADELVCAYKHKVPVIKEADRLAIVENIRAVDECFLVHTLDKIEIYHQHHFDVIFIGSDWKGSPRWTQTEKDMQALL